MKQSGRFTLTEDQVAEEAGFIRMEPGWPHWPILPVKNMHRSEPDHPADEDHGLMISGQLKPCKVYLMNMWDLKGGVILGEQLKDVRTLEYPTIEDAVRAGWIGD